jgi:hypothetical protein
MEVLYTVVSEISSTHLRLSTKSLLVVSLLSILVLNGCLHNIGTIGEYTQSWIGRPIEEMKKLVKDSHSYGSRTGWKEKTYNLDNGNWVYVEPDSKNCFIHWEVNPQGTIVGYKLEGNCR